MDEKLKEVYLNVVESLDDILSNNDYFGKTVGKIFQKDDLKYELFVNENKYIVSIIPTYLPEKNVKYIHISKYFNNKSGPKPKQIDSFVYNFKFDEVDKWEEIEFEGTTDAYKIINPNNYLSNKQIAEKIFEKIKNELT